MSRGKYSKNKVSRLLKARCRKSSESPYIRAVGKWHLGYCHPDFLPTRRGFDSFFGLWQQSVHYRTRMITCSSIKFSPRQMGYDLRRNESVSRDFEEVFSTNMFAKESVDIIRSHDQSRPLFLYLAFMALHTPLVGLPPKKMRKKFSRNAARLKTWSHKC